jgi:hypothetical protein
MHKRDSAPQARCFVLGSASILPVTGLIAGDAEYRAEMVKCVGTAYALPLLPLPRQGDSTSSKPIASLVLKRGDPSRRRADDYDVLEDGKVVGRIFHLDAAAPEGRPWMWASGHGGHNIKRYKWF